MLSWVVTFLIIALIAGTLGFGGIAGASIEIAKIIFFIAVVLFLLSAVIGLARAGCERGSELDQMLIGIERDLWVLMAELATEPKNRHKLTPGQNLVTAEMVGALEAAIDARANVGRKRRRLPRAHVDVKGHVFRSSGQPALAGVAQFFERVQSLFVGGHQQYRNLHGIAQMNLPQVAHMAFGGEGRPLALLHVAGPDAQLEP